MPETVDIDAYPDDVIQKAYWLQRHIHVHGIEGIHFMRNARETEAERGDENVAGNISARFRKL